jgi:hypothetical protein
MCRMLAHAKRSLQTVQDKQTLHNVLRIDQKGSLAIVSKDVASSDSAVYILQVRILSEACCGVFGTDGVLEFDAVEECCAG